jgi:hypothetical protein
MDKDTEKDTANDSGSDRSYADWCDFFNMPGPDYCSDSMSAGADKQHWSPSGGPRLHLFYCPGCDHQMHGTGDAKSFFSSIRVAECTRCGTLIEGEPV